MQKKRHFSYFNTKTLSISNVNKRPLALTTCFYLLLVLSPFVKADNKITDTFKLINDRLSYMKDVAAYKAQNHTAIEDRERERVVLETSKAQAEQLGLEPESITRFFEAQISAAKAIQYRYRADWLSEPLPENYQPQDLKTEIRPALIDLGNKTLVSIKNNLIKGNLYSQERQSAFIESISTPQLTDADKKQLFQGLSEIKLKPKPKN